MNASNKYSAISSILGYFYQFRLALFESLKKLKEEEPFNIAIETLDDIEIEMSDNQKELIQAKHKVGSNKNLTDASEDLWKTFRIWCEGYNNGSIPRESLFFLVTTETVSSGSAAYYLRNSDERNIDKALERLKSTVQSSSSKSNKAGYNAFKSLNSSELVQLFSNIYILDSSPSIDELSNRIRQELYYLAENKFLESVIQRLEGWWYQRILKQLLLKVNPIISEEISAEINRLREQFKSDNLPVDDDIISAEIDATGYQDAIFVKQLELIEINKKRISFAIRDYYRAFAQRSRWLRENLLYVGELDRYEEQLIEEWELVFEQTYDELPQELGEEEIKLYAKKIYRWIESEIRIQIRKNMTHSSIPRGTYQLLSDKLKVGWHRYYKIKLGHLLNRHQMEDS